MHPRKQAPKSHSKRSLVVGIVLIGAALAVGGGIWATNGRADAAGLPDLLGKSQPPLPKGALQVQDLQADAKGYTGSILVRGVVAGVSSADAHQVLLIDSREARVCSDLHCAKFYLQTKVGNTDLKPWDEINVRGTIKEDPANKMIYLAAESVENLGSIKK